jgi:threonine dehydrogenase-like Zn-dependent dehydrogenase
MTTATMRAARFDRARRRLTVQDVPIPTPGPRDVLVRVEAAGICASDLHMMDGTMSDFPVAEITPGHETAGTIERVGAEVPFWQPGQRVTIFPGKACGTCSSCASGGPVNECRNMMLIGQGYDGGWAEYVVVPFHLLTAVPPQVPIEQAAILVDAVATPYTGLVHRAQLRPGEIVGLWGTGGLGVHAVQIARLAGAGLIIAVDPLAAARERALEVGADHALDPQNADIRAEVMSLTDNEGLDLAVELSGSNRALDQAETCLGARGRALILGMCLEPVHLSEPSVLFGYYNHAVLGHDAVGPGGVYEWRDTGRLLRLAASGRLDLSRSVSHVVPLEDVGLGVEQLRTKDGNPVRIVLKP